MARASLVGCVPVQIWMIEEASVAEAERWLSKMTLLAQVPPFVHGGVIWCDVGLPGSAHDDILGIRYTSSQ